MIALEVVAEVRRLLTEEKLSQRKIARLTGVSRSTIAAIGSGKRPDYELLQRLREDDWEEPTGPAVRCPGCGNRVYMPCQLCRLRKRMAEKRCATGLASAGATGSASALRPPPSGRNPGTAGHSTFGPSTAFVMRKCAPGA